jgi:hypothetical protein
MEIKINVDGMLFIKRAGKWKKQCCSKHLGNPCGDWCPLFGEPDYEVGVQQPNRLDLCESILFSEKQIIDERLKAGD